MFALALDTSSADVTVGVGQVAATVAATTGDARVDVRLLASRVTVDARAHGELLTPSIEACLVDLGLKAADLAAIVVGVGPGPFTGLRVGLVTAAVLADTLAIPAYGVCSLDAVAAYVEPPGVGPTAVDRALLVATDARRREVYWASYRDGVRLAGPAVQRPAELAADPTALAGISRMAGAGARMYADVLRGDRVIELLDVDYPDPLALLCCAADRIRDAAPSEPLTPLYLRRPDAVEPGAAKSVTR
ncbi:MAG TPA: tRNA (adenosine(37)-N6)-threonylcarbamoyltransferase complex dimerization subunit type 1 TsaB [Jatrophihabitantaceae bacterium]|nr:tRNA (adenosine(37)-N6)-threonylcarbamoyltransferase complex dimerization subunit type 1 TsaB [Jatrophihabitantaceae bacterium]